jgi:gamma-glutamylcyclotransferase (GGCT)/AIG2-like uncharacterized protein YtfP
MEYLFSYGTLQEDRVQLQLFGRIVKGVKDVLTCYKIITIEVKDEAFLAKGEQKHQRTLITSNNKNDIIEGTMLEISEEELHLIDTYEPAEYKRGKVKLASGQWAWVYIASRTK